MELFIFGQRCKGRQPAAGPRLRRRGQFHFDRNELREYDNNNGFFFWNSRSKTLEDDWWIERSIKG